MAKDILIRARAMSITSRLILVDKDRIKTKTDRLELTDRTEAGQFAQILFMVRKKMKHRGISPIKPADRDWLNVKEIARQAMEFGIEFQLPQKEAFIQYCTIGLGKMKSFSILKFRELNQAIYKTYEAIQELKTDRHEDLTEQAYNIYQGLVNEKVGITNNFRSNPEKYIGFKKAVDEAIGLRVSVKVFIRAQFAALEWANSIPDPLQLYGDKAKERVIKYASENGITTRVRPDIDLSKLRNK